MGREVLTIKSDLEYIRNPVGFPVDVANSSPAILIAQKMGFNSIAFGTILESAYGIGSKSTEIIHQEGIIELGVDFSKVQDSSKSCSCRY